MKKILSVAVLVGGMIVAGAAPAFATSQLKVNICHNGTVVPVNVNATSNVQDVGHGLLDLDSDENVQSFTPHNANGHSTDRILRVYWKSGNDTETTWEAEDASCSKNGEQGPPGDDGEDGEDGEDGTDGTDGVDGLTFYPICVPNVGVRFVTSLESELTEGEFFLNAESGVCPLAGSDGIDGVDGVDGIDGLNGSNGTNGVDGAAGPAGSSGVAGAVGPAGPAGTSTVTQAPAAPEAAPVPATAPTGDLPRTGSSALILGLVGLASLAGGLFLMSLRRRSVA